MSKPNENPADIIEGEVITGTQEDFKQRAIRFDKKYQALCSEEGCQIVVTPVLVSTNHNTFEIAQRVTVGELPKQD